MGAIKRLATFGAGGLIGAAAGAAASVLFAPRSGGDFQRLVRGRLREARLAGVEAKAAKEEELIHRFRGVVGDPAALREEQTRLSAEALAARAEIGEPTRTDAIAGIRPFPPRTSAP